MARLRLNDKQIRFDLKTKGGMVDRKMVVVMETLTKSAARHTPIRSGYMRAHWDWERRTADVGLGYRLGNSADYAAYRIEGVQSKRTTKHMAVGRTQVLGNPWPAGGRITYAQFRRGYPGKDIFKLALVETAGKMRLL